MTRCPIYTFLKIVFPKHVLLCRALGVVRDIFFQGHRSFSILPLSRLHCKHHLTGIIIMSKQDFTRGYYC